MHYFGEFVEGALVPASRYTGHCQGYVEAGLVDELKVHVAPILLGDGTRLFDRVEGAPIELEVTRVASSPHATHLSFRPRR
jgi:riboflavin biosynthesis pyrimidine reductase